MPKLTDVQTTYIEAKRGAMDVADIAKALGIKKGLVENYIGSLPPEGEKVADPAAQAAYKPDVMAMLKGESRKGQPKGVVVMNATVSELSDDERKANLAAKKEEFAQRHSNSITKARKDRP